jgi:hypothetical protein
MGSGALSICRKLLAYTLIVGVLLVCALLSSTPVNAAAGISQQINFQGRLLNTQGATVPDGYYNIQFKIYQDGDGQSVGNTTGSPAGTLMWTEDYLNNNSQGVMVKNGFLSVQLGSVTAFGSSIDWNQDTLWLSMNIAGTAPTCTPFASCSPDGEMIPMKRLSSTPYSLNSGLLGGLASADFVQFAQGVQTDASNVDSIYINKTGSGNILTLQSSGSNAFAITNSGDIHFGANANHTVSVAAAASGAAGQTLTIAAGTAGSGGSAAAGGTLTLQGGNAAGTGSANGGDVVVSGGTGIGSGSAGLVRVGVAAFTSVNNTSCAANCAIAQTNVDSYSTVVVTSSVAGIVMTLPDPTNTSINGRIIYVTVANGSSDFTLNTNSGGSLIEVAMRQNATATMVWNGTDWTAAGASNATTLQATYNNGSNPSTTPEIKLDSTHGTIDIQDADTTIGADIFNIRASNAGNLGTTLLGVGNTGTVTIRNNVDQQAAFRFQNAAGSYILNVNTSSGYFINNGIRSLNNDLVNPGFEAGADVAGDTTLGEQGWFGNAQATAVNNSTDARSGNHVLQVTPNGTNLDVYGGQYYEVQPGDSLYFEGYVKNSAGANGTGGIQLTFYDKDKANPTYFTDYASLPGTSYILKNVNTTVPAGKFFVRASAAVRSTASSGTYYFDDFFLQRSNRNAPAIFANSVDSASAFSIQSASAAQTLFTANTTDNLLKVGDSTGTDTATTILVLDGATADPTTLTNRNGGLFYRSDSNSLKAVVGGAVVDICTTAVTCSGYSGSAGTTVQLQASSPGTQQTGHFNITGTGILSQLQTQDQSAASTNSSTLTIRSGNATGTTSNSGNLVLDVGTATGTTGSITIGHTGVQTTMPGNLLVQGANALQLGQASTTTGSIRLYNSVGSNYVSIAAAGANPSSSWTLTLPQNLGASGDCLKDSSGSGDLTFGSCASGVSVTLQDAYNYSSSPAVVTLANSKDLQFVAQETTTDPNVIVNLQCTTCSASGGRFAVQNTGTDVFTVLPNGGGIVLAQATQIGSATTDATQIDLQLDSYNQNTDSGSCTTTSNQGAMYYNTAMGSIRACINGSWSDMSNPDTLGLLSFGIVPSSGANPYDLPALVTTGVSGPCKVSWASNTSVSVSACVAYSGGRRVNVSATTLNTNSATTDNTNLTTTNRWGHVCLTGTDSQPAFTNTAGQAAATSAMPTFSVTAPILCLASVQGESVTAGRIDNIYDVRTFTSSLKEAVPASTAVELGMLADAAGTNGAMVPATSASQKLYGLVVASNGSTSTTTPNVIVNTVGPGWVKATAGTAGQFTKTSSTAGYGDTIASIPNNSFYYSAGNTRTAYSTTCTAASNCSGSLYVNFIVR